MNNGSRAVGATAVETKARRILHLSYQMAVGLTVVVAKDCRNIDLSNQRAVGLTVVEAKDCRNINVSTKRLSEQRARFVEATGCRSNGPSEHNAV